jgi:hypothetical protein
MAVYIGQEPFSGPFRAASLVEDRSGLYAVLADEAGDRILELDEAANLSARLEQAAERFVGQSGLCFAVRYTPGVQRTGRERLLQELLKGLSPAPPRAP